MSSSSLYLTLLTLICSFDGLIDGLDFFTKIFSFFAGSPPWSDWRQVQNTTWVWSVNHLDQTVAYVLVHWMVESEFSLRQGQVLWLRTVTSKAQQISQASINWFGLAIFCGWYAELNCRDVPNFVHKFLQKWLINLVSRLEVMVLGTPCRRTISLKNNWAILDASKVLRQAMKCGIFESRSTTTSTESHRLCVTGNTNTKSILTSSQGWLGIGSV